MSSRSRRRIAAGAAVLGGVLCTAMPAHAALTSPVASSYVVSATAIGNLVAVPPQPSSTYPPGGTNTLANLTLGSITTNSLMTATSGGDPSTGDASSSATGDHLGVSLGGLASLTFTGINSTCTATPSSTTGSGLITGAVLDVAGVKTTLTVNEAPNSGLTLPGGLGSLVFNQQSTTNGVLTVNAVHLTLAGGAGANVIIGQATCGAAPPVLPTPMVSAPIAAGTSAAALAGGVVFMRRRNGKSLLDAS